MLESINNKPEAYSFPLTNWFNGLVKPRTPQRSIYISQVHRVQPVDVTVDVYMPSGIKKQMSLTQVNALRAVGLNLRTRG